MTHWHSVAELLRRVARRAAWRSPPVSDEKVRDLSLRGECISMAKHMQQGNGGVPDLLRGAQMIYDWMNGGRPPAEEGPRQP